MERIMEEIYTEFHANRNGCGEIIRLDIVRILALLARMTRSDGTATAEGTSGDEKQALLRCVAYIERNYYLPLTLENAAKMCALSRSVFCRSFRTLTGYSFHQYVNLCRIRRAQELLRRGDRITALYSFCGYGDFSTFYRNFVRIVGVSPAAYRRMHKGKEE